VTRCRRGSFAGNVTVSSEPRHDHRNGRRRSVAKKMMSSHWTRWGQANRWPSVKDMPWREVEQSEAKQHNDIIRPDHPRWTWRNRLKRETVGAQQYLGAAVRATADRADLQAPSFIRSRARRHFWSSAFRIDAWIMAHVLLHLELTCPVSLQPVPASCLHHACAARASAQLGADRC